MTLAAQPSVHVMLVSGRMVEGIVMPRRVDLLCETADEAWMKLTTQGECMLRLLGMNLADLRVLYAGWVMDGAAASAPDKQEVTGSDR